MLFLLGLFLIWYVSNKMHALLRFSCQQARYVRAKALCCAGRREEALQEYFICVALKPDWTPVKAEAQKVHLYLLHHFPLQCLSLNVAIYKIVIPCCLKLSISSHWIHGNENEAYVLRFQCSLKMFQSFCLCHSLQILSEMFLSIFQNDSLVTHLHPLQTTSSSPRSKPSSLLSSLHFPLTRDGARAGCSKVCMHPHPQTRNSQKLHTVMCSRVQSFVEVQIKMK